MRTGPTGGIAAKLRRTAAAIALVGALALGVPALARATPPSPGAYQQDDYAPGRAFNIVPPGQVGFESAIDAASFLATGTRPPHQYDQNDMYANLVYATPGLQDSQILDYFKDGSFGVKPGDIERTETPKCLITIAPSANSPHCDDVTIVRDGFGVPHVYGQDRAALMFGLGYATGEDRLFLADALRHAGRADLAAFAGGANAAQDQDTYANAPYKNDAELQAQFDQADDLYGQRGVQIQLDTQNYVDGMNQWIAETKLDPLKLDVLYAATNNVLGPEPWKVTDIVATGALVAGIFGTGGGEELQAATALQDAKRVFGAKRGTLVWKDFRSADDPEAPRTVHKKVFPYRTPPKGKARGLAMPDPGSVETVPVVPKAAPQSLAAESKSDPGAGLLAGLDQITAGSNALLVSARESESGHPEVVFGPQTGYFAPQLLYEQDAHAPGGPEGPAIDARGVSFTGTNLYVQLGRGRDYAWSATSAGQDITDTFAVKLCEPDGSAPTRASTNYVFNGQCLPMDVLTHTESWLPSAADQTAPGSQTLRVYRTKAGLVEATATIKGEPYAFTKLRATYQHEVDSALTFADWNSPEVVHDFKSYMAAGFNNSLTFNWLYVDDEHIGYYNSGANPKRAKNTHPNFPVLAKSKFMWKDFNADLNTFAREPNSAHAHVLDQKYLTSWNNKEALGYRCDGIRCFSPVYRSDSLDKEIRSRIKGKGKMSLTELIDSMESAGTTDLRGITVVPYALKMLKKGPKITDPQVTDAIAILQDWVNGGAHRLDHNNDGTYDQAEAVRIIDAWWPLWVKAQFEPTLGPELNHVFIGEGHDIHDAPGPIGSAFQNVVYGFVQKDLRSMLGEKVKAPYSRIYCGKGRFKVCAKLLQNSLKQAMDTSSATLYGSEGCKLNTGTQATAQMCNDAVNATDLTVAAVDEFHWINRPTFQQAIEFQGHR
ncbi:MAG: penicillin acylase family protein [Solirubrobacterales bacterium]